MESAKWVILDISIKIENSRLYLSLIFIYFLIFGLKISG